MFTFKITTRGTTAIHTETGARFGIPKGTKAIAADKDGEVWAYESGKPGIIDGQAGWVDEALDGFVVKIGQIPKSGLQENGFLFGWRESMAVTAAASIEVTEEKKPLEGRYLRGRVTEILDYEVKQGKPGSGRARSLLRDLSSVNFDFTGYSTVNLVGAMVELGFDLRLHRDMVALKAIDGAVTLALANE